MKKNVIKTKILSAARKRMFSFGYRKVTMDEIAKDLAMSKNTIYKHYKSKEDIARALFTYLREDFLAKQSEFKKTLKDPVRIMAATVSYLQKELSAWFTYFLPDIKTELPKLWEEFVAFRTEQILALEALVKSAIRKGEFRHVNPSLAVRVYLGAINNVIDPDFLEQENLTFSQSIDMVMDIWSKGVTKELN